MSNTINSRTIGDAWLESIKIVLQNGQNHFDEDVSLLEILGLTIFISHPALKDNIISKFGDEKVIDNMLKKFSEGVVINNRPFTYSSRIYDYKGVNQFI